MSYILLAVMLSTLHPQQRIAVSMEFSSHQACVAAAKELRDSGAFYKLDTWCFKK